MAQRRSGRYLRQQISRLNCQYWPPSSSSVISRARMAKRKETNQHYYNRLTKADNVVRRLEQKRGYLEKFYLLQYIKAIPWEGLSLDHGRSGILESLCLHPAPIHTVSPAIAGSQGYLLEHTTDQRLCTHRSTFKLSAVLPSWKAKILIFEESKFFLGGEGYLPNNNFRYRLRTDPSLSFIQAIKWLSD